MLQRQEFFFFAKSVLFSGPTCPTQRTPGLLSRGGKVASLNWTTHFLVPRLSISGNIPLLHLYAVKCVERQIAICCLILMHFLKLLSELASLEVLV